MVQPPTRSRPPYPDSGLGGLTHDHRSKVSFPQWHLTSRRFPPSLPAQGEQRRSFYFNIRRDIPPH